MPKPDNRRAELAKIHLGAKQLGLDRDSYETMLQTVGQVRSAADLDEAGRHRVIAHLRSRGAKLHGRSRPASGKAALLKKIRAQLAAADRTDSYGDGIARRMFGVDRYEWCDQDQLRRIVAALNYDAERRNR